MKIKEFWIVYLLLGLLLLVFLATRVLPRDAIVSLFNLPTNLNGSGQEADKKVTVNIDFGEGRTVDALVEGETVAGVLEEEGRVSDIEIEIGPFGNDVIVERIDDAERNNVYEWIYFVNGVSSSVSPDEQVVEVGDIVDWKYVEK